MGTQNAQYKFRLTKLPLKGLEFTRDQLSRTDQMTSLRSETASADAEEESPKISEVSGGNVFKVPSPPQR